MASQIDPESARRIENAVWELAVLEYPRVWIGEKGMTADELLNFQMDNDELPEWMRVEPGELVQVEGHEGARVYPPRVAQEAVSEVSSQRYQDAMAYLIEQAALLGDAHIISDDDVGLQHPHGYLSYFFTRRALVMLDG